MSVLTKAEIAAAVSQQLEVPHTTAKVLVDSFFEEVRSKLEGGNDVKLEISEADCVVLPSYC